MNKDLENLVDFLLNLYFLADIKNFIFTQKKNLNLQIAVEKYGLALKPASERLKDGPDIVKTARSFR